MHEPQVFRTDVPVSTALYDYNEGQPTTLLTGSYVDGTPALLIEDNDEGCPIIETLSVNLSGYGLHPAPGNVFIKDYSEHEGLTGNLVANGIVRVVREVPIGMGSGYEVELIPV